MKLNYIFFSALATLYIFGCAASVGDRYSKQSENKNEILIPSENSKLVEDFDFTGYESHVEFELIPIEQIPPTISVNKSELWFSFEDDITSNKKKFVKKKGFRVQILSTDNYNQADSLKSILYFKTNHKNVYVDYESPFYKVKVGDYTDITSANELGFKLRQLGFQTTLIVADSVNTINNND